MKGERQLKRQHQNKSKIYDYLLSHPCETCGEKDPIVLDFDHIDQSVKDIEISLIFHRSWSNIMKEISKCRVLCANCHRRHTAVQMGYYKFLKDNN